MRPFLIALSITCLASFAGVSFAEKIPDSLVVFSNQNAFSFDLNNRMIPMPLKALLQKEVDSTIATAPCYNFVCEGSFCTAYTVSLNGC